MNIDIPQQSPVRHKRFRAVYSRFPKSDMLPVEDLPTIRMPTVPTIAAKERLPRDTEGRQFLQAREPGAYTSVLVRQCVDLFHAATGEYPQEILLERDRFAISGEEIGYYEPEDGVRIEYKLAGGGANYDVLVR